MSRTPAAAVPLAPPESRTQYRLSGILKGTAGGLAIINGGFYIAGDEIAERVRLRDISDPQAQIEVNGKLYRLPLNY